MALYISILLCINIQEMRGRQVGETVNIRTLRIKKINNAKYYTKFPCLDIKKLALYFYVPYFQ
jgi:hypothetical protein